MLKERLHIYILFVFVSFPLFASAQTRDYLAEGNLLLEQDQEAILGALNLWVTGYEKKIERGETDLELSFKIVKTIASKQLKKLYGKAHNIYFQSIKNADLSKYSAIFRKEVERILPLLSKSEVSEWSQYLKSDPSLLKNEIIKFWRNIDPVLSTAVNERLIEHWYRINYAQMFFTDNTQSTYGTDVRGEIFVRLGEPDARYKIDKFFRRIQTPDGFGMLFLDSKVQVDLEVWVYGESGDDNIIIFGKKYGFGELTLLENVLDGIDYDSKYIVDRYGLKKRSATDRSTRSLVLYGIFETLQGYHSRFSELYTNFRSRLMKAKRETAYGYDKLLAKFESTFNSQQWFAISNGVTRLEDEKSSLKKWIGNIPIRPKVYRFFDINEDPEYALVVQPDLENQVFGKEKYPLLYNSNLIVGSVKSDSNVYVPDSSYVELGEKLPNRLYTLKAKKGQVDITFVSEVFTLSNNFGTNLPVYFPANLLASSGRVHLELPDPIKRSDNMLISDIFVGKQQKINHEARFPFIPRIENEFLPKEDLLLYFEAYNIPEGGYKIEYSVSNISLLGIRRPIKERQSITLFEKEAVGVQKKYLSVSLSGLENGKFEVDLMFTPNEASLQPIERTIHFRITN